MSEAASLLKSRVALSPRVSALARDAVRYTANRILGLKLDPEDADRLAKTGDVSSAIRSLEERLRVTRAAPGVSLAPEFQQKLAVLEVAAEATNALNNRQRGDLIRQVVRQQVANVHAEFVAAQREQALNEYMEELASMGPRLRHFIRRADRLYQSQQGRLREAIRDPRRLRALLRQLDDVYLHHLKIAAQCGTPEPPDLARGTVR